MTASLSPRQPMISPSTTIGSRYPSTLKMMAGLLS